MKKRTVIKKFFCCAVTAICLISAALTGVYAESGYIPDDEQRLTGNLDNTDPTSPQEEVPVNLTDEQKQQVNIMLYVSPSLSTAHFYKEDFLKILDCEDRDSAKKAMSEWIDSALDCGLPRFKKCTNTMINWLNGILNSFSNPITNGFTEGCNNKIKVLKRNAYGYQNFNRFRNRILHMFAYKHL